VFLLGAAVLCWTLWVCRNDLVLKKKFLFSFASYSFGDTLDFEVGYSPEEGGSASGCFGVTNLGPGGHGFFSLGRTSGILGSGLRTASL
jgi:hypothetical protein